MKGKLLRRIAATALCLLAALPAGCSRAGGSDKVITFLNSKGEIQGALEDVAAAYSKRTGITVEIIAAPAGTSPFEKISQMYTSGNPPTMAMLDTTDRRDDCSCSTSASFSKFTQVCQRNVSFDRFEP